MTLNKKQPKGLAAMQRATPHGNEPQVPPSAAVAPEQEVQPRMDFPNQPAPDKRESKKRARAEEQEKMKRHRESELATARLENLVMAVCRKEERGRLKELCTGHLEFASNRPTVALTKMLLQRSSQLLEVQEWVRNDDGRLNQTMFLRANQAGVLATDDDGAIDYDEAAKKILAVVQHIYDYVMAMTASESTLALGREGSSDPVERAREAPPWPEADDGYVKLRNGILNAKAEKDAFHRWAAEPVEPQEPASSAQGMAAPPLEPRIPNAVVLLPDGDIVLPPLFVAAPARKSKSIPMLAIAGVALRMPKVKIAISVAPNKNGPLGELNKKIEQAGWVEAGMATLATTHSSKLNDAAQAEFNKANLFTYSHEETKDLQAYTKWIDNAKANGFAVISFHDEADTLVKVLESEQAGTHETKKVIELLRPTYALCNTRTICVSATLLPTVQDTSLWGSLFLEEPGDHVTDLAGLVERPVEPTDRNVQYIGVDSIKNVEYDSQNPKSDYAFTALNVRNRMRKLRPECIRVQLESAEAYVAFIIKGGIKSRALKGGGVQSAEVAKASYDRRLALARKAVVEVKKKKLTDPFPDDQVNDHFIFMPNGCVKPYRSEVATAMLACRTAAFISQTPTLAVEKTRADDHETHHISKMLIVSCTSQQQATGRDVAGGLAGYVRLVLEEAQEQKQPTAVLLYTSASTKSLETTISATFSGEAKGLQNPVKLFLAIPRPASEPYLSLDDEMEETSVVWHGTKFTCHPDAQSAMQQAHNECKENDCANLIPSLRVIAVGYDMFRAATTLSVSNLTIEFTPGKPERVHYIPKSMVLCHPPNKQLNVLYQMLGRGMNLLQTICLKDYEIDVLSHADTLPRVKCYYLLEREMVKCMQGVRGDASRRPDKMMGKLIKYSKEQAQAYRLDTNEFLSKSRVGLRNESLEQTLAVGNEANGGELFDSGDVHHPDADAGSEEWDYDQSDEDDDSVQSKHDILTVIYPWKGAINRPEAEWTISPSYKTGDSKNPAANHTFLAQCTKLEQDAVRHVKIYNIHGEEKKKDLKQNPYYSDKKHVGSMPDLVTRVLPTWYLLLWKLYVHKQWHEKPESMSNADRVIDAKKASYRAFTRCKGALGYLLCTKQFCPNPAETNAWMQIAEFAKALGADEAERKEALCHMLRALKWNTAQPANHTNHVTDLSIFLERVLKVEEPHAPPWSLPQMGNMPSWYSGTQDLGGADRDGDVDRCEYEDIDRCEEHDKYLLLDGTKLDDN